MTHPGNPTRPARTKRLRRKVRQLIWGHRRPWAALCVGLAVLLGLNALEPAEVVVPAKVAPVSVSLGKTLADEHPDLVVMPVEFAASGVAALLEAGDVVTVVALETETAMAPTTEHEPLAELPAPEALTGVEILAVPPPAADRASHLVIVGVRPQIADELAQAAARTMLSFRWER